MGNNNEYRPEQMTVASILREDKVYSNFDVKTEYPVTGLTFEGRRYAAVLDIALVPKKLVLKSIYHRTANKQQCIAIRMMGQIHEKQRKKLQDADQAQALSNTGWFVHDIWYNQKYHEMYWNPEAYTKKELENRLFGELRQYIYPEYLII